MAASIHFMLYIMCILRLLGLSAFSPSGTCSVDRSCSGCQQTTPPYSLPLPTPCPPILFTANPGTVSQHSMPDIHSQSSWAALGCMEGSSQQLPLTDLGAFPFPLIPLQNSLLHSTGCLNLRRLEGLRCQEEEQDIVSFPPALYALLDPVVHIYF